jgi:hypothetical protein
MNASASCLPSREQLPHRLHEAAESRVPARRASQAATVADLFDATGLCEGRLFNAHGLAAKVRVAHPMMGAPQRSLVNFGSWPPV